MKIRVADLDELSRFGSVSGSDPKKNKKILILLNFDLIRFRISFFNFYIKVNMINILILFYIFGTYILLERFDFRS